jgi:hypothetical protein
VDSKEHLRWVEDDFAVFLEWKRCLRVERGVALEALRPVWVETFGPGAPIPVAAPATVRVAPPVVEVEVVAPKNRRGEEGG